MRKTIRLTGRRQLAQSSFSFHLSDSNGSRVASLEIVDATALKKFPNDAEIRVKLVENKLVEILNFGTVAKPVATALVREASFRAPSCQVRIVSRGEQNGLLLGSTSSWTLKSGGAPDGILLFQPANIAPRLWKLVIEDQDPILYIDERLPDAGLWARTNPVFAACVLPHVISEIMRFILDKKTAPETGWEAEWMVWADGLMPGGKPPFNDIPDEQRKWIDELVAAFAQKHDLADGVLKTIGSEK